MRSYSRGTEMWLSALSLRFIYCVWTAMALVGLCKCAGLPVPFLFTYVIIRDYHMGFWLSPAVSTWGPIIKPESFTSRADNGRGLILGAMTKTPCYNLFITYSKPLFLNNSSAFIPKQRVGNTLSHKHTIGYRVRYTPDYVTSTIFSWASPNDKLIWGLSPFQFSVSVTYMFLPWKMVLQK